MKAQQELVAAVQQLVPALLVEPKLHILTTRRTVILTMQLLLLKALLQLPKLLLLPLKVLHQQPKLLLLKLQHQPLKALLQLQKQSRCTVRCI